MSVRHLGVCKCQGCLLEQLSRLNKFEKRSTLWLGFVANCLEAPLINDASKQRLEAFIWQDLS